MLRTVLLVLLALAAAALPARAQSALGGCVSWNTLSDHMESINANHYKLITNAEVDCNDMQFFADEVEIFNDADRVTAKGNVVFVSTDNRISAERMEFNTRTRTGTFYNASGIASMANRKIEASMFGTQEPDAYFWGQTIEKLGPKTYRVTRGGFTTCVQPTPRWEIVSDAVTITLEKHAVLKNSLLMVKGVPLLYVPIMYYPINKGDRATGFLIPTYGSSTVRGQTISNAFFWAIDRSQDATLNYDYFSKTGSGMGGEYRYVQAPGSQGNVRTYFIREHDAVYRQPNGTETNYTGTNSYQVIGTMSQVLPGHFRATASANYFSSFVAQQRYQQNVIAATNTTRSYSGSISGSIGRYNLSGSIDHSELFYSQSSSTVYGSLPRIDAGRAESPIGKLPLYFGVQGEFITLQREDKSGTTDNNRGLTRMDVTPSLRFPFTKWPFLTFNNTLKWRETYWTESLDPSGIQVPTGIGRHYFSISSSITGPVFDRIFSNPADPTATKFKHVIEPDVTIQHTSTIDNANRIVRLDGVDSVVGNATNIVYSLTNRLYAKKDVAREILTIGVQQTYYTDANSALVDQQYQSSFNPNLPPTNFSPVAITVHASPSATLDTSFRTEFNAQAGALQTIAANGSWRVGWVQATGGWSDRRYIPHLNGFDNPAYASNYVNGATTVRKPGNGFGGTYTFNYDLKQGQFLQQRYIVYYNSQCCGIMGEYQTFNYGSVVASTIGVPRDHRFNLSFTLAGIGSFSNLLGAFGGQNAR